MARSELEARRSDAGAGPQVGRLIDIADAATVALAAAALWTLFSGSSRWVLFGAPVSLTFVHATFAAAVVGTARHAVRPQPSLLVRARGWSRRIRDADDFRIAAAASTPRRGC